MKKNPTVYEINTRVWIKRFGTKNLSEVPDKYWNELKNKGIDFIWLMGVWSTVDSIIEKYCFEEDLVKSYGRALKDWKNEDVIGSPFAIDNYEVNPNLGGSESLLKLKSKLNGIGLGLILDFIPNHFSAGSKLIKTHPEVFLQVNKENFVRDPHTYFQIENEEKYFAHGRDPFFPAWQDTVQVNYYSMPARKYLTEILKNLTGLCDGVRCDVAMLMLNNVFKNTWSGALSSFGFETPATEFWQDAIAEVKNKRNDFLFIAEAYWDLEWELQQQGFDFTYDKKLTDRLRFGNASSLRDHLLAEPDYQKKSLRFLENHDETRAVAAFGKEREKAAAIIISTIQGMRLFYDGQFEGKKIRLPVQLGREPVETISEELQSFYDKLVTITREDIFKNGDWNLLQSLKSWEGNESFQNLLCWLISFKNQKVVVIVNYSDIVSTCRLKLSISEYSEEFHITDLLTGQTYMRSAEEVHNSGLYIELKPWQSHIFQF